MIRSSHQLSYVDKVVSTSDTIHIPAEQPPGGLTFVAGLEETAESSLFTSCSAQNV